MFLYRCLAARIRPCCGLHGLSITHCGCLRLSRRVSACADPVSICLVRAISRLNLFGFISGIPLPVEAAVSSRQQNSENWINEARRRLADLRGKKPETKAGQIWALWPEIKAAIDDRQSIKSIRQWLEKEAVIAVTTDSLRTYVRQCRAKETARQVPTRVVGLDSTTGAGKLNPAKWPQSTALLSAGVPSQTPRETEGNPDTTEDPMAGARKALNKPRFDIRKIHGDGDPSDRNLI